MNSPTVETIQPEWATRISQRKRDIRHVQIILKTVERCNIACKYCYFFFGENQTYKAHPPYISRESLVKVTRFLREGISDCRLETLCIGLHGGEPLMQKKADFDWMCTQFESQLGHLTSLDLVLQTNGMLIDDEWIDLFEKHKVRVGVSLDGPQPDNDLNRIDHLGRGTHARSLLGLKKIKIAADSGRLRPPSLLCVINPALDPKMLFDYFHSDLGLLNFDFLLPELPTPETSATAYGEYLCRLFDVWISSGNADINLRIFLSLISKFSGTSSFIFPNGTDTVYARAFKISSDATLYPDDVLHNDDWWTPRVDETNLNEWLESDYFLELDSLGQRLPAQCVECCWSEICGGGHPWNRYSKESGFQKASSLCEGLKLIYAHTYAYLLRLGISKEKLHSVLRIES